MRKGLAIDVTDMEVDGSVFRKKHGRILVPWVERLDELWLINGYLDVRELYVSLSFYMLMVSLADSPESCIMNCHVLAFVSDPCDQWASQLGSRVRPSRMIYRKSWLTMRRIWKCTARHSGRSTRSTDVSWTRSWCTRRSMDSSMDPHWVWVSCISKYISMLITSPAGPPESCVMNYHRPSWRSFSDPCDQ